MDTRPIESVLCIAVLAGGESPERDVSLRSGDAVACALRSDGHRVVLIDPANGDLVEVDWSPFDACFVALHGGAGEDGRVQQQLERTGVPYTGSGPQACRWAMSKSASKQLFREHQVPTPPSTRIGKHDAPAERLARLDALGYPLIVKPDNQGSSLGISIVRSADELDAALQQALAYNGAAIAERLVRGREFTLAVIDDEPLPLIEIVSPEAVFSYEAKYHSSLTEYRFDFDLPREAHEELVQTGLAATRALGTRGLSRVDLMFDNDGRAWVLEVNTVPGLTERSLAPQAAQRAGLDMRALCDLLVRQCLTAAGVS